MNGLVVFVEGAADGWYVLRALGQNAGAQLAKEKPALLPTPFGKSQQAGGQQDRSLILNWHARASLDDLTLAASSEGHEPVFQVVASIPARGSRAELKVFIVRMGGDRRCEPVWELIERLKEVFDPPLHYDIQKLAVAFVFDADTPEHFSQTTGDGLSHRLQWFKENFGSLEGSVDAAHGKWQNASPFPWGLYVWHDVSTRNGTIENVLHPSLMAGEWARKLNDAESYLATHADPTASVRTKEADKLKAQITIAGQLFRPGSSLAQVIRRGDPTEPAAMPTEIFSLPAATALSKFLVDDCPWPDRS